jgi:predicted short-subunit dehydrogenase-like oxidoreductase (DUF2520 family)
VLVIGRGKVGTALARGWRHAGWTVATRAGRQGPPSRLDRDLVVLAVRDPDLPGWAIALARCQRRARGRSVVVHCAGASGLAVLGPLRSAGVAVGQLHPFLAIADGRRGPTLAGGYALVQADRTATGLVRRAARALGLVAVPGRGVERGRYHAAAALLAGGSVALAAAARTLLGTAGVAPVVATRMLASLLRSVADNLTTVGLPGALTGPVRRGDAETVARLLAAVAAVAPDQAALLRTVVGAQLALARDLGEAEVEMFAAIADLLRENHSPAAAPRLSERR